MYVCIYLFIYLLMAMENPPFLDCVDDLQYPRKKVIFHSYVS
jgi:hypothetical protein